MSDVRHVPMLAQFNELDGEYNRLFERHAKVQQELFDARASVRTLAKLNAEFSRQNAAYEASGVRLGQPWWRQEHPAPCPVSLPGGDKKGCTCKTS